MRRLILSVLLLTCSIVGTGCGGQAGLEAEVSQGGKNDFVFDLKD